MTPEKANRFSTEGNARGASRRDALGSLRPMKTGELLDRALRIYQRLGVVFLRQSAPPTVLCLGAIAFVTNFVWPRLQETRSNSTNGQVGEAAVSFALAICIGGPLFLMGISWTMGIVSRLVSDHVNGLPADEDRAVRFTRAALPRLMKVTIRSTLISLSGIIASLLLLLAGGLMAAGGHSDDATPGILTAFGILGLIIGLFVFAFVMSYESLAPTIAMLEPQTTAKLSSKRSRALMKKAVYHPAGTDTVVGAQILLTLIALLLFAGVDVSFELVGINGYLEGIFGPGPLRTIVTTVVNLIPGFLTIWTIVPAWGSIATLIYYDRRIRLEGYDIESLAAQIDDKVRQ